MKSYRHSAQERYTNLALSLLFVGVSVSLAVFSGSFWIPLGLLGMVGTALVSLVFANRFFDSHELVQWDPEGPALICSVRGQVRRVELANVSSVRVVPCALKTTLVVETSKLVLSHKLIGFEDLLEQVRQARPDLFPAPGDTLRLRSTLVGIVSLLLFSAGTALTGTLLDGWLPWLGPLFYAVALVPLVRIVFFYPLEYRICRGKVIVRYPGRCKTLTTGKLKKVHQETYASAGSVFFVLRLEFVGHHVVLDEGYLRDSLRPRADWLGVALN